VTLVQLKGPNWIPREFYFTAMELWQWRCGKRLIDRGRHVSDAGTRSTEGVGKWWWQNWSPQAANPFLPQPSHGCFRSSRARSYFDGRASLVWHESATTLLRTCGVVTNPSKATHWVCTRCGLHSLSEPLHNHYQTKCISNLLPR
jgi:hypothetical protein